MTADRPIPPRPALPPRPKPERARRSKAWAATAAETCDSATTETSLSSKDLASRKDGFPCISPISRRWYRMPVSRNLQGALGCVGRYPNIGRQR